MYEFWVFIFNAILLLVAFKIGQISAIVKISQESKQLMQTTTANNKSVLTIEKINGIFYAYDGDDFIAQGSDPDELGKTISNRFHNKYKGARIQFIDS